MTIFDATNSKLLPVFDDPDNFDAREAFQDEVDFDNLKVQGYIDAGDWIMYKVGPSPRTYIRLTGNLFREENSASLKEFYEDRPSLLLDHVNRCSLPESMTGDFYDKAKAKVRSGHGELQLIWDPAV